MSTCRSAGPACASRCRAETSAWVNYYRFATDYPVGLADIVHSWALGTSGHPSPGWTLGVEYTRGPDQLEMLTIDRTGVFEANTYSAFAEFLLTPMFSGQARYDYQDRPEDVRAAPCDLQGGSSVLSSVALLTPGLNGRLE